MFDHWDRQSYSSGQRNAARNVSPGVGESQRVSLEPPPKTLNPVVLKPHGGTWRDPGPRGAPGSPCLSLAQSHDRLRCPRQELACAYHARLPVLLDLYNTPPA